MHALHAHRPSRQQGEPVSRRHARVRHELDDPPVIEGPPKPLRMPTKQLGLVWRDGRCVVGIAHAGEVLAHVVLGSDELRALHERLTAIALEAGVIDPPDGARRCWCGTVLTRPRVRTCDSCKAAKVAKRAVTCMDCGATLRPGKGGRRRCEPCRLVYRRAYNREASRARQRTRPRPARWCLDCGADITPRHGTAKRCQACARQRTWKEPAARACRRCGVDISERPRRSTYCVSCAALPKYRRSERLAGMAA